MTMRIYPDELCHHGILGMKWGVRNGPPYPLGANDHSASEKKAGWRKSVNESSDSKKKKKSTNRSGSDRLKRVLQSKEFKIALGVSIAAVGTYAAYKYGRKYLIGGKHFDKALKKAYKEIDRSIDEQGLAKVLSKKDLNKARKGAREATKNAFESTRKNYKNLEQNFSSLDEIPKAAKNYAADYFGTNSDDAYNILTNGINHGVDEQSLFTDALSGGGRHMNCTMCSAAMAMRMKGYEVTAAETKMGVFAWKNEKWFEGAKFIKPKAKRSEDLYSYLQKTGEGHYGFINVQFLSGNGHSVFYTVKNGAVEIMDGQMNKSYGRTYSDLWDNLFSNIDVKATTVCDVTDCKPTKKVLVALRGTGDKVSKSQAAIKEARDREFEEFTKKVERYKAQYLEEKKHGLLDDDWSFYDWLDFMRISL